jgi:riboflavin biosynthesis pyrimidine reductase
MKAKFGEFSSPTIPMDEILDFYFLSKKPENKLYCWSNSISSLDAFQHFLTGKSVSSIGLPHITNNQKADHRLLQASWSFSDAILISGQICRDEEDLDCRINDRDLIDYRIANGKSSAPVVVILSRSGEFSLNRPLFNRVGQQIEIYTMPAGVALLKPLVENAKATITLHAFDGNLSRLFDILFSRGIRFLDISTGGTIINEAISLELLDELRWTQSGCIIGPFNDKGDSRPKLWSGARSYGVENHPLVK